MMSHRPTKRSVLKATKQRAVENTIRERVSRSGAIERPVPLSENLVVTHLADLDEDLFVVPPSGTETVFGFEDLSLAMRASGSSATVFSANEGNAYVESASLRRAVQMIESISSEIAGEPVGVHAVFEPDDSSDDEDLVVTVAWPSADEARLLAWNDALMTRIAREIPAQERAVLVVMPASADAHPAG